MQLNFQILTLHFISGNVVASYICQNGLEVITLETMILSKADTVQLLTSIVEILSLQFSVNVITDVTD